jgi:cbb3-type cytochrome oxidase maturation protein
MSVVVIQVFVSLLLVAGSLVLFVHSVRQRDYDHADRLALAPLEEDNPPCKQNRSNTTTP